MSDTEQTIPEGAFLPGTDAYVVKSKLGAGSYCDVYLVREIATKQMYAAKFLADKRIRISEKVQARFEKEVSFFSRLKHPSIIELKTILRNGESMIPIFEYASQGTLYDLLKRNDTELRRVSFATAYDWIVQLLEGVGYMHEQGVIHRDLTPKNILVRKTGSIAICDLGVALDKKNKGLSERYKHQTQSIFVSEHQGTNPDDANELDDIYSLGQMCFYLMSNIIPRKWVGKLQEYNPEVPSRMAEVIDAMRAENPETRPASIKEVLAVVQQEQIYADRKRI